MPLKLVEITWRCSVFRLKFNIESFIKSLYACLRRHYKINVFQFSARYMHV